MKRKLSAVVVILVLSTVGCVANAGAGGGGLSAAELSELQRRAAAQADMAAVGIGSLSGIGPGPSELQWRARAQADMAAVGIGSLSGIGPGPSGS